MKVIYNNLIPFKGFAAINLLGFVFARKEYGALSEKTLNHEAIHTAQMREMLYLPFYLWYVVEWLVKLVRYGKQAYQNISFEREAYGHDRDPDYLSSRQRYEWFKLL